LQSIERQFSTETDALRGALRHANFPANMSPRPDLGAKPHLAYTDSRIERAAERRTDETALRAFADDPQARAYVIGGELIVTRQSAQASDPLFALAQARALDTVTETVFLGLIDNMPRFGFGVAPATAEALKTRDGFLVTDLRSIAVQGLVAPEHLPPIAEAKAVLHWHARHRFCSNCGAATQPVNGGWRRDCPQCKVQHFPRTDPVVIMLAVDGERCLLGRSPRFMTTMWSCLAGFVEPGESIEDAVHRETLEEAGIRCGRVTYFGSQPWPFPTSLMIGAHAEAVTHDIVVDRDELEDARWFSKDEVVAMMLRRHPQGITVPPAAAIAHHIIRAWVDGEIGFD
jgi:NAD+ diphosphatase